MNQTPKHGKLVLELNEFDVFFGRGKSAFFRPGNVGFRKLAKEKAEIYQSSVSSSDTKTMKKLAEEIIAEINARGGRFVRPVTATNASGEMQAAWEIVGEDLALVKTKQAIRDSRSSRTRKNRKHKRNIGCTSSKCTALLFTTGQLTIWVSLQQSRPINYTC